jgi:hypothetical protein
VHAILLILSIASDDGVPDLRRYSSRVEYTNLGSCDCFYVKLAEPDWGGIAKPLSQHFVFSELEFRRLPGGGSHGKPKPN